MKIEKNRKTTANNNNNNVSLIEISKRD